MSEEIFSSTGSLGREVRQDNRLYENGDLYAMRPIVLAERFLDLREDPRSQTENVTRWILRGVVNDETMSEIQADRYGLRQHLEVAMPLAELGRPGWLIYLAHNEDNRQTTLVPLDEMLAETASYQQSEQSPAQHVEDMVDRGFEIRTVPNSNDIPRLGEAMWGPGFGWEDKEINAFIARLHVEHKQDPPFFAGLYAGGLLVGAAEAETLRLPTPHSDLLLVESTEWYMHEDYRGQRLMPAVIAALNAQAIRYYAGRGEQPLIHAECNFASRSDRAGHASGFRIPPRHYANQILSQHVTVDDGVLPKGLRDFTFVYLPQAIFYAENGYDTEQTDRIMRAIEQEALV